jgi:hypothetical protein
VGLLAGRDERRHVDMKLELMPIPVTEVDRAKACYAERLGFAVDVGGGAR